MDILYLMVFIFSIVFTWLHGDIVDERNEQVKKFLKGLLDNNSK